ncbi:nuclear transport factor 2 family protein [Dyella sp. LX-66]|uniref:nuclear transport factor 2 family protein n=1 Tax=unclassified Dyella TaxID=2634549 RepID=UPI001BE0F03F|nr:MULTISPECIES: nuclear transport factor 2 family protein [unclassified Dyella]MBT2117553.1 nuclear transport factor 2 family protein [Dyella sp. LX-1]MBT2141443.1 nuclear transport factor 2 family protein [Dyella sp. LX-66]
MSNTANDIARRYVDAMASKDVDTILSISSDHIVCTSPLGQITGIDKFRGFQEGFARMIVNLTALAVFGDEGQAVVVYDVETHPVARALVAEYLIIEDGKIAATDVIYDATPFAAYAAGAKQH